MAPSTSSFLDLKAQISKQEAEFAKSRSLGKEMVIKGGVQRPDKKPTIWARPNKGVASRNARDLEWTRTDKSVLEAAKDALERKALQYEKLKKGKTAGLTESQLDSLLVDFDQKAEENDSDSSEDVDESATVPQRPDEDDPIVEYVDELGRTRTAPRSEVPRHFQPSGHDEEQAAENDPYLIYGNVDYFPTYEQSAEKIAAVEAAMKEDANPTTHFDSTRDVRARAAGFYQFSKDEETRQKQMEELRRTRQETERERENTGASTGKDVRPGMEKRKRDLEERRKAVEAKRRKTKNSDGVDEREDVSVPQPVQVIPENLESTKESKPDLKQSADDFLAALEREMMGNRGKAE